MKELLYEGDGWLLCYKRFADGHLQWPRSEKEAKFITGQQYRWLMDGLAIEQKKTISQVSLRCTDLMQSWTASEAVSRIAAIYHVDNMYKDTSASERLENRKRSVKPLVDAYFEWVKKQLGRKGLDKSSKLAGALNYSVNQEQFLRVFLEDGEIPPDNNDAEHPVLLCRKT